MQRPTVVVAFGFLNIVFGLLGMCGTAMSVIVVFGPGNLGAGAQNNPFLVQDGLVGAWLKLSVFLGAASCLVLIASGFGLLAMREWARKLSLGYAVYSVFSLVITLCVFVAVPMMQRVGARPQGQDEAAMAGAVGGVVGGCVGIIYPLLL
jgi:hypothetical protein